jgi:hypothetical protein
VSRYRTPGAAALVLVALAALLTMRVLRAAGWEMDEGAVLTYAIQVLHGAVPHRDFQSFYGPGNPWLVAAVFKAVGPSMIAERFVGLAYRLVLAGALLYLVRRRGVAGVLACGGILLLLLPGEDSWAWASYGALAFGVTAIAFADARRPLLAGVAAGVAVLMRFDWALAVGLASLPYVVTWSWRDRRRALLGLALGAGAYVPHVAVVGPAKVRLLVEQLRATEPARHLPLPPWHLYPGYVFALMLLTVALLLVVGARRRGTGEGLSFIAVGLLGIGLVPGVLARTDHSHIVVAAVAPLALLPVLVPALVGQLGPVLALLRPSLRYLAVGAATLVALSVVVPWAAAQRYRPLLGLDSFPSYTVTNDGRSFRVANDFFAQTAAAALRRTDELARPGQRVFIGPLDMRRTNYADSYLYYLLPKLRPASFYIELNPKTANEPGSGLARDLARADVLILTTVFDPWPEQNGSQDVGSALPNRIVRRDFCARGTFGFYQVFERCHAA